MSNYQLSINNYQLPDGYKQTEVGVIPEDWNVTAFGELYAEPSRNGIYKSAEYQGQGTRIVNMGEMFGLNFISGQEMNRVLLTPKEITIAGLRDGDLLFGRRSVVPTGAGKCSIVINPPEEITFESSIIRVRLNSLEADPLFHYYYFASPVGRAVMSSIISGTNIKGIRGTELKELKISQPPLSEQKAIATTLSDIDALIAKLDKLIAKKRHIKTATMQQLLTGKKRLPGFGEGKGYQQTEVGLIPEDWDVCCLDILAKLSSGTTPSRSQEERYYQNGRFNWVKTTDLNNSRITKTGEKVTQEALDETCLQVYPPGTVFVAMYGGFNQIGRTGLLDIPAAVNQALVAIQTKPKKLDSTYLLAALNYRVEHWKSVASSSRKDPNITSQDVKDFILPLPHVEEQSEIATVLSDIDTEITALETRRDKTQAIKQGMMQELITGRTRLV